MAVGRKGWRRIVVDERQYFWRAIGTDWGIEVLAVTEAAFTRGATAQQLKFELDYNHLQTPRADRSVSLKQRAAVAPGVVALAIRYAVSSTPSFTGDIGESNVTLPPRIISEIQEKARLAPHRASSV